MRHLHGDGTALSPEERTAFEHHLPSAGTLVAFGLEAWPHLLGVMRSRTRRSGAWSGRLTGREAELSMRILGEVAERGPICSEHIADGRRAWRPVWGASSLAKSVFQKLFFHGRLLIARRDENNRRLYDLPEKVLPKSVLGLPEPPEEETARWETLLALRQRRIVCLKRFQLPLVEELVQEVRVEGCPALHCLREDISLFDQPNKTVRAPRKVLLLAPLDPLIYNRRLTSALWDFDYIWEAYTPASKRKRGHYALPVVSGAEIVGHVDLRADRSRGRLCVVSRSVPRGHRVSPAVAEVARFLGLR